MIQFKQILLYQFGFFVPNYIIDPEPSIIAKLLQVFEGTDFVPNIVHTMQIGPMSQTRQQLQLMTKDMEWSIEFEPHRISINKNNLPGKDIGTAEQFAQASSDYCSRLSDIVSVSANRLSFNTRGILHEMSKEELEKAGSKLLNLPTFYTENRLVEWNTRAVARYDATLNGNTEILNVISDISRIPLTPKDQRDSKNLDCLEIGFDINTFQDNKKQRFRIQESDAFIKEAIKLNQRLLSEIDKEVL